MHYFGMGNKPDYPKFTAFMNGRKKELLYIYFFKYVIFSLCNFLCITAENEKMHYLNYYFIFSKLIFQRIIIT